MEWQVALESAALAVREAEKAHDPDLAAALAVYGDACWGSSRRGDAEHAWRRSLELRSEGPHGSIVVARSLLGLSEIEHARGNLRAAIKLAEESLSAYQSDSTTPPLRLFRALKAVGILYVSDARPSEALPLLQRASSLLRPGERWADLRLAALEVTWAEAHRALREVETAVPHFERAIALYAKHPEVHPGDELDVRRRLATSLSGLKRNEDAVRTLEQTLALAESRKELESSRLSVAGELAVALSTSHDPARLQQLHNRYPFSYRHFAPADGRIIDDALPEPEQSPTPGMGAVVVRDGQVTDASRVVSGMRALFRACYNEALARDPNAGGWVRLRLAVGAGGNVEVVSSQSVGLDRQVVECVLRVAGAARFAPPGGGSAVIIVPVTFVRS